MIREKKEARNVPYSRAKKKDKAREAWMKLRVWVSGRFLPDGRYHTGSWVLKETEEE